MQMQRIVDYFFRSVLLFSIFKPLPARQDVCRQPIIFANSLDPDHDLQNVGHGLDLNCLTLW